MASIPGLNNFKTFDIPDNNKLGAPLDVSDLASDKTALALGTFNGSYIIEGSHDGVNFTPVIQFKSTGLDSELSIDFAGTFASLRVKRQAFGEPISINLSGQLVCPC